MSTPRLRNYMNGNLRNLYGCNAVIYDEAVGDAFSVNLRDIKNKDCPFSGVTIELETPAADCVGFRSGKCYTWFTPRDPIKRKFTKFKDDLDYLFSMWFDTLASSYPEGLTIPQNGDVDLVVRGRMPLAHSKQCRIHVYEPEGSVVDFYIERNAEGYEAICEGETALYERTYHKIPINVRYDDLTPKEFSKAVDLVVSIIDYATKVYKELEKSYPVECYRLFVDCIREGYRHMMQMEG